jgi:hypothetical protein
MEVTVSIHSATLAPKLPTMPVAITWEYARDMLREYVFAAGQEFKYNQFPAKYMVNGMPSCLIGHLLYDLFGDEKLPEWMLHLGVNDKKVSWEDSLGGMQDMDPFVSELFDLGMLVAADEYVRDFLKSVQDLQDFGINWWMSVEKSVSNTVIYKRQYEHYLTMDPNEVLDEVYA